jgi:DNA excision repair protein ERCC-2
MFIFSPMSILVDLDKRLIRASIRDLVESQHEGLRTAGLMDRMRAELGNRIHQEYRQARENNKKGFCAEQSIQIERQVDGYQVILRGRLDGLIRTGNRLVVEEVKSVVLGAQDLSHARAEYFLDFCLQLRLYALALHEAEPDLTLEAKLILVSLLDQSRRELPVSLHPDTTSARLDELVRQSIKSAKAQKTRCQSLALLANQLVFPYSEPRPYQKELQDTMAHGLNKKLPVLAMAPTGIGKTVCALSAGLSFSLTHNSLLVFLTAKTTQQRLVEKTFEDLCCASGFEFDSIRCLTLQAKKKMCPSGDLLCHPHLCPYLVDFQARLSKSKIHEQLINSGRLIGPDCLMATAEAHRLCPFYVATSMIDKVELLICDYNYVYDPSVALSELVSDDAKRPSTVIIDEAHNLFDRAREAYSPYISVAEIRAILRQIKAGSYLAEVDRSEQLPFAGLFTTVHGPDLFSGIQNLLDDVIQERTKLVQVEESFRSDPVDDCRPTEIVLETWKALGQKALTHLMSYVLYNRTHQLAWPDDPILDLLGKLSRLSDVLALEKKEFLPYLSGPNHKSGEGFGCLCLNPAERLDSKHRQLKGIVAMSATLNPLSYYSDVLGFSKLQPETVSMPSPFPKENLGVWIQDKVSTTFRERDNYLDEFASIITTTCQARPGRYVAFFPSFNTLNKVQSKLQLPQGQLIIQLPGLSEHNRYRMLDKFRNSQGSCLLMAVMGGIFAEGVDLPGDELIGAMVFGPGIPQVGFERAAMQHYFQDEYEQGFAYAMLFPGMQRVIQSAGRVIRTPEDCGVIILAGKRFAEPQPSACLPEHWYQFSPQELVSTNLEKDLARFWESVSVQGGEIPCTDTGG